MLPTAWQSVEYAAIPPGGSVVVLGLGPIGDMCTRVARSVIDAVGMEAHGSPAGKAAQRVAGLLPDPVQAKVMDKAGVDRLAALYLAIAIVRRGGTRRGRPTYTAGWTTSCRC